MCIQSKTSSFDTINDNCLLGLGDCLDLMQEIPDDSVNLTVTSPPYDNLRTYNGNISHWGEHVWKSVIKELFRLTKQGGVVAWIVGDATIKGSETGTSFKQALWAMDCGFKLHDTMIWNKPSFPKTHKRYEQSFEYMFVFAKGNIVTFNGIRDKFNKKHGKLIHSSTRQPDGTTLKCSGYKKKLISEYGLRTNVWETPSCKSNTERTGHPAQFSEKIAQDHIISWSNECDTILDPFMGSGTTGVACKNLNRKFIGIEKDSGYFEIAVSRICDEGW